MGQTLNPVAAPPHVAVPVSLSLHFVSLHLKKFFFGRGDVSYK